MVKNKFSEKLIEEPLCTAPPSHIDELIKIISKHRELPLCIPIRPIDAANWWVDMQEPMSKYERPRQVATSGKDSLRWDTPYINRICINLRKFLMLKKPDHDFIVGAKDDGVWWRGDDMRFFHGLYDEAMMQKDIGKDRYRKRVKTAMRGLKQKLNTNYR